ncbi:MAG: metallophosphoesterase [Bacteroidales bacterium]|nr:metallophosphoesterase [Bacteroidales bacterium]
MLHGFTLLFTIIASILMAIIPTFIWLICWIIGKCAHVNIPFAAFGWTAIVLIVLVWITMAYGFFIGRFRLETKTFDFTHSTIPYAAKGYKIVHISDLHLSTFNDRPNALQKIVDSINAQQPDLICFTGDLVTLGVQEAEPFIEILRQLKATDGIVSVLGNHDFLIYRHDFSSSRERLQEVNRLSDFESQVLGWHLLRNENLVLPNGITIIGVDNCSCANEGFKTIYAGNLPQAMAGTSGFRILLTHDPGHWRAEAVGQPIALTLSGHTHSGQVRLFGKALSGISFKESAGWFHANNQALYINSGLGCTLPIRLNCPEEITIITLKNEK